MRGISVSEQTSTLTIEDVAEGAGGRLTGDARRPVAGVSIDSRTIAPGQLFVAVAGPKFDGHDFVAQAVE